MRGKNLIRNDLQERNQRVELMMKALMENDENEKPPYIHSFFAVLSLWF